jgi:hypothetical protein
LVYEARPLALRPPLGFFPSLRVHAGVLAIVPQFCATAITAGDCVSLTRGSLFRSWVAISVPLPPATVTLVRYLAQSGCTFTESSVTNCFSCMKPRRAEPLPNPKRDGKSGAKISTDLPRRPKGPPRNKKPKIKPYGQ